MGFVVWFNPPMEKCPHILPENDGSLKFGVCTVWRCDTCGQAWEYRGGLWDARYNESYWVPEWKRAYADDGIDTRARPSSPLS